MNVSQAKDLFAKHQIKYVLAQFVDIHGAAKAKAVPVEHLEMVLNDGAGFAGFALWGFGMGPDGPDYMAVGDLSTLVPIPWMPGYARLVCNGTVRGKPYPYCSRVALQKQLGRLTERGLTMFVGIEPEFMLLSRDASGKLAPSDPTDTLDKPCYDYKGLSRTSAVLDDITAALRAVGIDVYQIDHEDANGQFEVNFTYSDALKSADNFTFVKMAASEIARKHGLIATFMPKPFSNRTGSGAHFHISMGDSKVRNLFEDKSDRRGLSLSTLAYHFLGGVLAHARALAAVCAPTVNSYKRLVVGRSLSGATWAPAYVAYGDNNRTACVRIPAGGWSSGCGFGINPYLALAALVPRASTASIASRRRATNLNMYELSEAQLRDRQIALLANLLEAITESTRTGGEGRPRQRVAAEFIKLKRMEWDEYARHVSDWESTRYLSSSDVRYRWFAHEETRAA